MARPIELVGWRPGDTPQWGNSNDWQQVAAPTNGQFWRFNSTTGLWAPTTLTAAMVTAGAALTKTDDTNVTLTLGGSPTVALLAASSITVGWSGTLAASRGGTGVSAWTWTNVSYTSTDYTATVGTWTVESGDLTQFSYLIIDKTMFLNFRINTSSVSDATQRLKILLPAGKTAAKRVDFPIVLSDNGTAGHGLGFINAATTSIDLFRDIAATNWAVSTNLTSVGGFIAFEIQ